MPRDAEEHDTEDNKALLTSVLQQRIALAEQIKASQETIRQSQELLKRLDLIAEDLLRQ